MISLQTKDLHGFEYFINSYRPIQNDPCLDGALLPLLLDFFDESDLDTIIFKGFSDIHIASVEKNGKDSFDILFEGKNTPWVKMYLLNDATEIMIRGGPAVYKYMIDDDHCNPLMWRHSFFPEPGLDSALIHLADKCPGSFLRETKVFEENFIYYIDKKIIFRPVKFSRSSALEITKYLPQPKFEVREEVLPFTALGDIIRYLNENKFDPLDTPSVVYFQKVSPDEIKENYSGPKDIMIDL